MARRRGRPADDEGFGKIILGLLLFAALWAAAHFGMLEIIGRMITGLLQPAASQTAPSGST